MSQHDFNISNQLTPQFRADLNDALVALASNSSGGSAPATTYANQFWYDSSSNILKIRNEANSAWINLGYVDQSTGKFSIFEDTLVVDNLGVQKGKIGSQVLSSWQSGLSTDESLISPSKLKSVVSDYQNVHAWVNFNGIGAVSIRGSYNVSSVTRLNTGNYVVNFSEPMPNANYAVSLACDTETGLSNDWKRSIGLFPIDPLTTNSVSLMSFQTPTGGPRDVLFANVVVFK